MFLLPDGGVAVNEVAPRPHNSGHYTMDACATSQFEQALRAVLGWPLGDTAQLCGSAVMYNILLDTPWSVWFQTQILGRATVKLLGYVPKGVGVGEAFPGTVFRDWANWINSPDYWFGKADVPGQDNFEKVTLPYLSIGLRDDPWGTKAAIDAFMKHYSNAQFEQAWLEPGESGKIGHLGFFRRAHRDTHWHVPKDFLLQG